MSGISRLQAALVEKDRVWGGWVVGPTVIGPEEFARCGYDYVGFDTQHGYLDAAWCEDLTCRASLRSRFTINCATLL